MIYLDHNATTPVRAEVLEAMTPYHSVHFGNPSSVHQAGQAARRALEDAREELLDLLGAKEAKAIFTSGGTESINLAIRGLLPERGTLFTSPAEHHAVLRMAESLARENHPVVVSPVDSNGLIPLASLADADIDGPLLASIQHANNETGVIQPVEEFAGIAHTRSALIHTDACQSVGKIPVDFNAIGVDALSLAAHKFGGPKGVGALILKSDLVLRPDLHGGTQESGLRPGTENVAGAVGLVTALRLALNEMDGFRSRLGELRNLLERQIQQAIPDAVIHGTDAPRLENTVNVGVRGVESQDIVMAMDLRGIAISAGAACDSGAITVSHVLEAMGIEDSLAVGSVRFSLGRNTDRKEVERAAEVYSDVVLRLRSE